MSDDDLEIVANAFKHASMAMARLMEDRNVELMRPSDIVVSVANVLDNAAEEIRSERERRERA